jgi:hypothetical protein
MNDSADTACNTSDQAANDVHPISPPMMTTDEDRTLNRQKLKLEIEGLEFNQRFRIELLKSLAAPIAIIGFVVTFILGIAQYNQAARARDDERFDKAVGRLAAPEPTERLAGIAGLELFLGRDKQERHRDTLHFLINALAVEKEPTVRAALLDVVTHLTTKQVASADLNDALEKARDRNRGIFEHLQQSYLENLLASKVVDDRNNDETLIGNLTEEQRAELVATAKAITALIRNGARVKDLSAIYCVECDFSGKQMDMSLPEFATTANFSAANPDEILNLSGTDFHNAILRRANFIGVNLRGASFDSADLIGTNFSGADLQGAKLTDYSRRNYIVQHMLATKSRESELSRTSPALICRRPIFLKVFS